MSGPKVCAGCGAPVPEGRRRYCSPRCSHRTRKARFTRRQKQALAAASSKAKAKAGLPAKRQPRVVGERFKRGACEYVHLPGHPLAQSSGSVLAHRLALFDSRGGSSRCDVCAVDLGWRDVWVMAITPGEPVDVANGSVVCKPCGRLWFLARQLRGEMLDHPAWADRSPAMAEVVEGWLMAASAEGNGRLREASPSVPPLTSEWGNASKPVPDPTVGGFSGDEVER